MKVSRFWQMHICNLKNMPNYRFFRVISAVTMVTRDGTTIAANRGHPGGTSTWLQMAERCNLSPEYPPSECLKCVRNRALARSVVGNLLCSVRDAASNVDCIAFNTQLVETGLAARASSRHGESFLIVTEGRIYMTHYKWAYSAIDTVPKRREEDKDRGKEM